MCKRAAFAIALVAGAAALGATPGKAAPAMLREDQTGAQERTLVLEVWLNGLPRHKTVELRDGRDGLSIAPGDLSAVGLLPDEHTKRDSRVMLNRLSGVTVHIDEAAQRLIITADRRWLAPNVVDLRPPVEDASWGESEWGAILDYDLLGTVNDIGHRNDGQLAGQAGATLFSPYGIVTATGLGLASSHGDTRFVRLDTSLVIDDPGRTTQWIVGDAISSSLRWSRSIRFAGLQVASDFSLRPELATLPLPDITGDAVVPSAVDVFVGSTRVFSGMVDAGPFRLDNLPISAGGRDVRVTVRDALGRESAQTINVYTTNAMLAEGLLSYSAGLGFPRLSYARESFDYGDLSAQASLRYGLSDSLTVEAHAEGAADLALGGIGAVLSVPPFGIVESAFAASVTDGETGVLGSLGFETRQGPLNLFANATYTTPAYADLGALEREPPDAHRIVIGANLNLGEYGAIGGSFVDVDRRGEHHDSRLSVLTYALTFDNAVYFGLTSFHDHTQNETAVEAYLSIPLDGRSQVSSSLHADDQGAFYSATYDNLVNPDGGFGYRLTATGGRESYAEASATWRANQVILDGGVAMRDDKAAARIGASGALVTVDSSLFASRRTDGAFALVKSGQENVRVYRENREIARTDADGETLLSDLPPYLTNRIAVEPDDYPMSTIVGASEAKVRPRRRSVAVVDLRPTASRGLILEVRLDDGTAPKAGTPVTVGDETLVVGHNGEIFIADPKGEITGMIEGEAACRFTATAPTGASAAIPRVGPVVCIRESAA